MDRHHQNAMILLVPDVPDDSQGKIEAKVSLHSQYATMSPTRSTKVMSKKDSETNDKEESPSKSRRRNHKSRGTKKDTKRVHFHGKILCRAVSYIDKEDFDKIWYTAEDFKQNRKREVALQKSISSNKQLYRSIRENLNAEGVLTDEQESRLQRAIDESTEAVFREQEKQEKAFYDADKKGTFALDCRKIAKVYRSYSEKALKEAQRRAARHEKHLEAIGINFLEYSSPCTPSTFNKKGILRRHSANSQKKLTNASKLEIPRPPIEVCA